MPRYTPETIPDDPYRVAPSYCAPGEIEPPDAPQVSDEVALRHVLVAIGSYDGKAFGLNGDDWCDYLLDSYPESLRMLLIAILDESEKAKRWLLRLTRWKLTHMIAEQANDWLAEADADALEREGWL